MPPASPPTSPSVIRSGLGAMPLSALAALWEGNPDGILWLAAASRAEDEHVQAANPAARRLLGRDPIGQRLGDIATGLASAAGLAVLRLEGGAVVPQRLTFDGHAFLLLRDATREATLSAALGRSGIDPG